MITIKSASLFTIGWSFLRNNWHYSTNKHSWWRENQQQCMKWESLMKQQTLEYKKAFMVRRKSALIYKMGRSLLKRTNTKTTWLHQLRENQHWCIQEGMFTLTPQPTLEYKLASVEVTLIRHSTLTHARAYPGRSCSSWAAPGRGGRSDGMSQGRWGTETSWCAAVCLGWLISWSADPLKRRQIVSSVNKDANGWNVTWVEEK